MKILTGEGSLQLAEKVAILLNQKLGNVELSRFPNGENKVLISENCENEDVVIFQNFCAPVDQNIFQFSLMVDAVSRMHPKKIIGVIPWLGYAKQDKVFREGEALASQVVAKFISSLKLDKLFLLDIHHPNIKNFFTIPVEELSASDVFVKKISNDKLLITNGGVTVNNFCVVSPDFGALARNKYVSEKLNLPLFQIDKMRDLTTGKVTIKSINFVGVDLPVDPMGQTGRSVPTTEIERINGKNVIMIDDMILSGGTIVKDSEFLKSQGVKDIYFFVTHFDPTVETFENLKKAEVEKIIVSDSLDFSIPEDLSSKIAKISVSNLLHEVFVNLSLP